MTPGIQIDNGDQLDMWGKSCAEVRGPIHSHRRWFVFTVCLKRFKIGPHSSFKNLACSSPNSMIEGSFGKSRTVSLQCIARATMSDTNIVHERGARTINVRLKFRTGVRLWKTEICRRFLDFSEEVLRSPPAPLLRRQQQKTPRRKQIRQIELYKVSKTHNLKRIL